VEAFDRGDYAEADRKFEEAYFLAKQLGATDPRLAASLSDLVKLYGISNARTKIPKFTRRPRRVSRQAKVAERILGKTEELRKKSKDLGRNHLDIAGDLDELAKLHKNMDLSFFKILRHPTERLYTRALAIRERNLGPSHPEVARSLERLAVFRLNKYGDLWEIAGYAPFYFLRLINRALAIREKAYGPDHPEVARSLERLARWHGYRARNDFYSGYDFRNDDSKRLLKRALTIWEKALGSDHPEVARSLERLARCYEFFRNEEGEEGVQYLERALAILEKDQKKIHVLNQFLVRYAPQLRQSGRTAEAEKMETRTEEIRAALAQQNLAK